MNSSDHKKYLNDFILNVTGELSEVFLYLLAEPKSSCMTMSNFTLNLTLHFSKLNNNTNRLPLIKQRQPRIKILIPPLGRRKRL